MNDSRMTHSVPEAQLEKTEVGHVVQGEGWFVLNARDAPWWRSEEKGLYADFEGKHEFSQLGFNLRVLMPGQHDVYHGESDQEDFLVLSGECVLVIEGEERRLKAWDFVHCPPWTLHAFAAVGDGPCVIVMAGSRAGGFEVVYAVDDVAAKYGASVVEETSDPQEANARFGPEERTAYQEGWLPS
jgi:quercetin dioxygenase-like cupin family protein